MEEGMNTKWALGVSDNMEQQEGIFRSCMVFTFHLTFFEIRSL
jgi:hypothetical protein